MNRTLYINIPYIGNQKDLNLIQSQLTDKILFKFDSIEFDLQSLTFITPFGMMLFIILVEHIIYDLSKEVIIILPDTICSQKTIDCMSVIHRLGFFDSLPKEVNYVNRYMTTNRLIGTNPEILELTKIESEEQSLNVITKAKKALLKTNYDENHISDIAIMISEIVQNIFIHSDCDRPAFIAIQSFAKKRLVQLAIADSGVGIPETLKRTRNFSNYTSDSYLIRQSLKARVSQFQETEERGEGLMRCRIIAQKHAATFYVRSNAGYYYLDFAHNKSGGDEMYFLIGTQFFINFPVH